MDITEAFAPGAGSEDLAKTDFFDFVVSPTAHGTSGEAVSDEEGFLHRTSCRSIGVSFLQDSRQDSHDSRHDLHSSGFVKETNNNTLTALPPVSTITGSLTHHHHHHHHHHRNHVCTVQNADVTMEQPSDCDYWGDESKEQTCNILLEDLSKYCWSTSASTHSQNHGEGIVQGDATVRGCTGTHRQNTDGAIYTLTVLNNDANSMDALDCCKSPAPPSTDSWSMRPNLDLDAILNLDPSGEHDHESVPENSRSERFHVIPVAAMGSQYSTEDSGFVESKEICGRSGQTPGSGDNNNDWKLSDQNHLSDGASTTVTSAGDSAESLLRSALQGKLYSGTGTQVVSSSSSTTSQASTLALQSTTGTAPHVQIIANHQTDETMHPCTEEDLLLSQLDATTYRPGDYEKLKSIANEVVDAYCNLEPVCNVSATTTVMYTLDPASGSLGTITLPADLSQVSTVTVVTAGQQDAVMGQSTARTKTETAPSQIQLSPARAVTAPTTTKPAKKYVRRVNRNGSNSGGGNGGNGSTNGAQQQGSGGSPGSVQRKERSLHYCSICSKGFKDKYSVNVHIRTHTGEKPFACSLCGKSFRQKAHLAKHYQTHVAQKPTANVSTAGTAASNSPAQASTPTNGSAPAAETSAAVPAARSQALTNVEQSTTCNTTTS